jgi:hypothetical protein
MGSGRLGPGAIEDAYVEVAPKSLLKRQDLGGAG